MNNSTEQIFLPSSSSAHTAAELQLPSSTLPTVDLENVEDFSNVCRVCATVTEMVIPIFRGEGLRNNLADKIYKHLPIKVSEQDSPELPVVMCYQCASTLLATHELVKCSMQADAALRTRARVLRARRAREPQQEQKTEELNPPSSVETVQRRCAYCPARLPAARLRAHVLAAHLPLVFLCEHCDAPVSRRLLLPHMTAHAAHAHLPLEDEPAAPEPPDLPDRGDAAPPPDSAFDAGDDPPEPSEPPSPPPPPPPKRERACPHCGKTYRAASSYFYHVKHSHARSKEHECGECGARFGTRGALREHAALHSSARPLQCPRCPKRFRSRASLYIHRQTHGGARAHACAQCGRAFRWRAALRRHAARHAADRAHACAACGRAFSVRADLLRHARTHAAARAAPLACPAACGATFAQPRYLRAHLARKHPAPPAHPAHPAPPAHPAHPAPPVHPAHPASDT